MRIVKRMMVVAAVSFSVLVASSGAAQAACCVSVDGASMSTVLDGLGTVQACVTSSNGNVNYVIAARNGARFGDRTGSWCSLNNDSANTGYKLCHNISFWPDSCTGYLYN